MILSGHGLLPGESFSTGHPTAANDIHRQILHIYDARGNEFEHAVEMTGRLYTMLALFMHGANARRQPEFREQLCTKRH